MTLAVDTIVPAGIVDDNALQALLPALKWAPNLRWTIPVFASGQNRVRKLTLTVRAVGTVTVPAGSFQAYMTAGVLAKLASMHTLLSRLTWPR